MSAPFIKVITRAGERWDLLAWKYYGDSALFSPIVMANPAVPIAPVLATGTEIAVPILHRDQSASADLPPWKRSA
jgi:phage tail protein X